MPNYRRNFVPGGTYFFTVVVHERRRLFQNECARQTLREAILDVQESKPFKIIAICLLPDHIHTIWELSPGDDDYPVRWRRIKEEFSKNWIANGKPEGSRSQSRINKNERGIWQRRYWEHTIEDEYDLERCVDYTHWNPRKHGWVSRVRDYAWSSFFRFVEQGSYDIDWGGEDPCKGWDAPEWGE